MSVEAIKIVATAKFDIFDLNLREDGILHVHIYGEIPINISQYKSLIGKMGEVTSGGKVPILATADELQIPEEEVRKYMLSSDSNPYSLATALIAHSISQKLVGNFFQSVMKPRRPIKIFTNEQRAVEWLKEFESLKV